MKALLVLLLIAVNVSAELPCRQGVKQNGEWVCKTPIPLSQDVFSEVGVDTRQPIVIGKGKDGDNQDVLELKLYISSFDENYWLASDLATVLIQDKTSKPVLKMLVLTPRIFNTAPAHARLATVQVPDDEIWYLRQIDGKFLKVDAPANKIEKDQEKP